LVEDRCCSRPAANWSMLAGESLEVDELHPTQPTATITTTITNLCRFMLLISTLYLWKELRTTIAQIAGRIQ
jgi:hypothetical protein